MVLVKKEMKQISNLVLTIMSFLFIGCSDGQDEVKPNWYKLELQKKPSKRYFHAMAYDSARNITVLFGGANPDAASLLNDTWEFDGTEWKQIDTKQKPSKRWKPGLAFDPIRRRIVLFGGANYENGSIVYHDTWEYDGENWIQIETNTKPPRRLDPGMTFDWNIQSIIMIGGADNNYPGDSWKYDGVDWSELPFCDSEIYYGEGCRLVFDEHRSRTILYGGGAGPEVFDKTWEFDGNCWKTFKVNGNPEPLLWFGFVYDSEKCRSILYGGGHIWSDKTYELDDNRWIEIETSANPGRRATHSMVYDSKRNNVLLFGGISPILYPPNDETWIYH